MRLASHGRRGLVREGIENSPIQIHSRFQRHGRVFLALALLGLGGLVLAGSLATRWHSSSTASRAHIGAVTLRNSDWMLDGTSRAGLSFVERQGLCWDDVQEPKVRARYRQGHWEKLQVLRDDGVEFSLQGTPRSNLVGKEFTVPRQVHRADAENSLTVGRRRLRLVAVAGAWDVDADSAVAFYDARTGEEMDPSAFPKALHLVRPSAINTMQLRLLFEVEGEIPLDETTAMIFDARTHAVVGMLEEWELPEEGGIVREGNLMGLDVITGVWHDTPLEVMMEMPIGAEQRQVVPPWDGMPQAFRFEAPGGRRIELTRLIHGSGYAVISNDRLAFNTALFEWMLPSAPPYHPHENSVWDLGNLLDTDQLDLRYKEPAGTWMRAAVENQMKARPEMELVFQPETARCWFRIEGLPMAPNSRESIRDFFDIRIPGTGGLRPIGVPVSRFRMANHHDVGPAEFQRAGVTPPSLRCHGTTSGGRF